MCCCPFYHCFLLLYKPHISYPHHTTRNMSSSLPHPQQPTVPETSGLTLWCISQAEYSILNAVCYLDVLSPLCCCEKTLWLKATWRRKGFLGLHFPWSISEGSHGRKEVGTKEEHCLLDPCLSHPGYVQIASLCRPGPQIQRMVRPMVG